MFRIILMGRKSRMKKERKFQEKEPKKDLVGLTFPFNLLLWILKQGVYFALFTPLILSSKFYFPFVAPKSLYFMGVVEILFFLWLILAIYIPRYRPNWRSPLLLSLAVFLAVITLSGILGANFSRSFWSKYERMDGILMMFHLFAFFLVVSSIFKAKYEWRKIFLVSLFVTFILSILALCEIGKVQGFIFSQRGGTTVGNTSFLGSYILFNLFLALYLLFREKKLVWRIFEISTIVLGFITIYLSSARAATLVFLGGSVLIFLFYLAFEPKRKWLKILGKISLFLILGTIVFGTISLCQPGSFVQNQFAKMAGSKARPTVWASAWQGFLERPWLGWGLANFDIPFLKHFNPHLFLKGYGKEVWFDRAHNIIFDTLAEKGIIGLIAYLSVFTAIFYLLWKKYFQEKKEGGETDFMLPAVFSSLLIAYFIQNLTVFDMVSSYMMLYLVLGFIASQTRKSSPPIGISQKSPNIFLVGTLAFIFILSFREFVWLPTKANMLVIKALSSPYPQTRVRIYKEIFQTSPLGKFQIRELIAQNAQNILQKEMNKVPRSSVEEELNFVAGELEKDKQEHFLNYKSMLRLAELYNFYSIINPAKNKLAEKTAREAIKLSPRNPQAYWVLAQAELHQHRFKDTMASLDKAINLEPMIYNSHRIAIVVARMMKDKDLIKKEVDKALSANPAWKKDIESLLTKS